MSLLCVFVWILLCALCFHECVLRMISLEYCLGSLCFEFLLGCFLVGVLRVISLDNVWQAGGGDKQTNSCTCPIPHLRSAGQLQVLTISGLFCFFFRQATKNDLILVLACWSITKSSLLYLIICIKVEDTNYYLSQVRQFRTNNFNLNHRLRSGLS